MAQSLPYVTLLASVGAGLMAGLFFAFSNFIMTALSRLPAGQGMAAMQGINASVTNVLFGLAFFGTAALCLLLLFLGFRLLPSSPAALLIGGALCYLVGVIAVTLVFNVPLNNSLAATAAAQAAERWPSYVDAWLRWNHVRTAASMLSLALFAWSLFAMGSAKP